MANIPADQLNQTRQLIDSAKSVLIVLSANPSMDSVASSLSLYLALSATGKQVTVVSPTSMTVEFNQLVGVEKIVNSINATSGRNLVISFPYQEGSIEKVSYNIENDSFNLVIEPREGYPTITSDVIRYSYGGGGNTDLVITVGTSKLTDLDHIYQNNQGFFPNKPILNIDSQNQNTRYGKINIVDGTASSTSELVVSLLSQLGFSLDTDVATNLLLGITSATLNFTSNTTSASTFEAAAICARIGARKFTQAYQPMGQQPAPIPYLRPQKQVSQKPYQSYPTTQSYPQVGLPSQTGLPAQAGKAPQPAKFKTPPPIVSPHPTESTHPETPPDWLKPKIYKGSTLL